MLSALIYFDSIQNLFLFKVTRFKILSYTVCLYIISISKSNLNMNDTPLSQKNPNNNQSNLLTNTYAFSPQFNMDQSSTQAQSIQKILATSIQRAKQKINMLQGRHREERPQNKSQRASSKQPGQAVAAAMKILQVKVAELQRTVQNQNKQRTILEKQLQNISNEKKIILLNLQQTNKKNNQLEQTARISRQQIKDITNQMQAMTNKNNELDIKCKGLQMKIRHLQEDKQQLSSQLNKRSVEKINKSPPHKYMPPLPADYDDKQKSVGDIEKKLQVKEKRLLDFQHSLKQRETRLSQEKNQLNSIVHENSRLKIQIQHVKKLLCEVQMKQKEEDKSNYESYLMKIRDMQNQLQTLRQTTKMLTPQPLNVSARRNESETQKLREELNVLSDHYEDLLCRYKRTEQKSKRDERQSKAYRDRIRQLEDMIAEIVEKINKSPHSTKELKYLAIKANKLITSFFQRVNTVNTPTKSRSNSLNRSISRSNSQKKTNLRKSRDSNSGSASKVARQESGNKSKRVVVSQNGWEHLEKEIVLLKKQYKKYVKLLDQNQNEQTRKKVNELAFTIQQKNEEITRIKQKAKNR